MGTFVWEWIEKFHNRYYQLAADEEHELKQL